VWTPPESGRTRVLSFVTKPWHPNQDNPTAGRQNMRPRLSPSVPRRCGRDAGQHTCVPAATASELETSEPGGEEESHRFCVQHQAYRPPDKNRDVLVARDAHTRAGESGSRIPDDEREREIGIAIGDGRNLGRARVRTAKITRRYTHREMTGQRARGT
jgi:hypothetical protein